MIETEPTVFLIAEPRVRTQDMLDYLGEVGGEEWFWRVFGFSDAPKEVPAAEGLIEFMGRLCYKSWEPGLNRNVTRVREDRGDYLLNILRSAHGSVLEHAYFSFALHDVSRVVTAELNRHRAGVAISEQSLRYVRLDELRFRVPPVLKPETQIMKIMLQMEGMDDPDLDFAHKKMITSALRRAVPMGISTEEGWTANVRTIRHVIEMRSAVGAEEEIRIVADQIAQIMQRECPLLFGDYDVSEYGWTTPYRKV
jgi:thymidylate synthase (FAD)